MPQTPKSFLSWEYTSIMKLSRACAGDISSQRTQSPLCLKPAINKYFFFSLVITLAATTDRSDRMAPLFYLQLGVCLSYFEEYSALKIECRSNYRYIIIVCANSITFRNVIPLCHIFDQLHQRDSEQMRDISALHVKCQISMCIYLTFN